MSEKKKSLPGNWIIRNLLLAAAILVALLLVSSIGLSVLTRHNKTVIVPDFTNMTVREAAATASESHLKVKVTDSVFIRRLASGAVYRQSPKPGAEAKKGRHVFLTINSVVPKKIPMPNLVGYSLLEAKAELINHGLSLGKLQYVPDMATNNVLEQKCGGRSIKAGSLIVNGSEIDLVLGLSPSDSRTTVPKVTGMKYIRAVDTIHDNFLNVGKAVFDKGITSYRDSVDAVVYKQEAVGTSKTMGSTVAIWLTLDESKVPVK